MNYCISLVERALFEFDFGLDLDGLLVGFGMNGFDGIRYRVWKLMVFLCFGNYGKFSLNVDMVSSIN